MQINFDTATRNILVLDGTGSGKTSAICYPALFNLAEEVFNEEFNIS